MSAVSVIKYDLPQRLFNTDHEDGTTKAFQAPSDYLAKCGGLAATNSKYKAYCALGEAVLLRCTIMVVSMRNLLVNIAVIMADEAIGNTVCALEATGLASNMLLVLVLGDNGGSSSQVGGG